MSQPSRKRRKKSGGWSMSNFLDAEADEGDDDEYEEGYDEDVSGAQFNRHVEQTQKSFEKPRFDMRQQFSNIADKYIERQNKLEQYQRQQREAVLAQQHAQQHAQQMAQQQRQNAQQMAQQAQLQIQQLQLQQTQHAQQMFKQMQQQQLQFQQMQSSLQNNLLQANQQAQIAAAAAAMTGAQVPAPVGGMAAGAGGVGRGVGRGRQVQMQQRNNRGARQAVPGVGMNSSSMGMGMGMGNINRNNNNKRGAGGGGRRRGGEMDDFVENDMPGMMHEGGIGEEEQGNRMVAAALPSVHDPKLWMVPCMPGKERTCVMDLLKKFFKYKDSGKKALFIKTAFTTDMNTGYIYVEAYQEIHVRRAVEGIFGLNAFKIRIVPPSQMPATLEIKVSAPEVSVGQWARFKTGLYKGDLCQVFKLSNQESKVIIRCIPRIDLASINIQRNAKEGQSGFNQKSNDNKWGGRGGRGGGRFGKDRNQPRGARPPARFFNRQQMIELGETVGPKELDAWLGVRCYKWQYGRFRNGFALRSEHIRNLDFDISVLEDEYEKWQKKNTSGDKDKSNESKNNSRDKPHHNHDDDHDKEDALLNRPPPMIQKSCDFVRGDTVKVISGALINLIGEVKSVAPDPSGNGNMTVLVIPHHKDLSQEAIPFDTKELQKFFKPGDHVKCMKGAHKDETGLILSIDEVKKEVIIFADLTDREICVPLNDITETTQVSSGRDILGQYSLYELVSLNRDVVGVITEIKTNTLTILDNKGGEQHVRLQDIKRHSRDKYAIALDKDNNEIRIGDVIIPQLGDFRNQRCTVKHIYRQVVFCHSKTCTEHAGIFVTRARLCRIADRSASNQQKKK